MERFGNVSRENIEKDITDNVPKNTRNTQSSIWRQFDEFCRAKDYSLNYDTPIEEIAQILTDWAYNMKKKNGDDYKESVVKTIWNTTAKLVQEMYFKNFNIKIDPFTNIIFKEARDARNTKRKLLQRLPEKRKVGSTALTKSEIYEMAKFWKEEDPEGLQKKFFHIASFELAWRGGEAVNCKVCYFKKEMLHNGTYTGRLEYNSIFTKTAQGGNKKCMESKWLTVNQIDKDICPVRLFNLLIEKRGNHITSERLFLTVNPYWKNPLSKGWYKNMPIGKNELSKWTKDSAEKIGLDVHTNKITNHSNRASTVSTLSKSGISDQQVIKITGHSNANSIKPYLQLDTNHHANLVTSLRDDTTVCMQQPSSSSNMEIINNAPNFITNQQTSVMNACSDDMATPLVPVKFSYNNCVFNNCSFN